MSISSTMQERSQGSCELCTTPSNELIAISVPPKQGSAAEDCVALCPTCATAINTQDFSDVNHWRALTGSIWSEVPPVQVMSYQLLKKFPAEDWAQEALDGAFLDDALLSWANFEESGPVVHKDAYGTVLEAGDNVLLIQNLNVKGANFIAPKGTMVKKIRLVADNADQIEGKINGDTIVILAKYVKKSV